MCEEPSCGGLGVDSSPAKASWVSEMGLEDYIEEVVLELSSKG